MQAFLFSGFTESHTINSNNKDDESSILVAKRLSSDSGKDSIFFKKKTKIACNETLNEREFSHRNELQGN